MAVPIKFFFFKQKTAYEVRISDWSSDVCSSDRLGQRDGQVLQRCAVHLAGVQGDLRLGQRLADLRRLAQPQNRRLVFRHRFGAAAVPPHHLALQIVEISIVGQSMQQGRRKSDVEGKEVSVIMDTGGRLTLKKKNKQKP